MKNGRAEQLNEVKVIFDIIHGKAEADMYIKNLNVLDVHTESVYEGSILVYNKKIVAINPDINIVKYKEEFDGEGLFAIPGLIDAHFHYESQLAHPAALAEAMVPNGTTTIYAECLDILSAAREDGIKAAELLFKDYEKLPYRLYAFAPGKKTSLEVTEAVLEMDPVIGLGEFEHFSYSSGNEDDFQKAAIARDKGLFINGHWGLTTLTDMELNYLPAAGVTNNHDVWSEEDIEKSLRYGFGTQIKFGVGSPKVIENLIRAIIKRKFPAENFQLCSDNISIERLLTKGHMDWIISEFTRWGMDPIKAIKMASYYSAKFFGMDNILGSLTPGRYADIVLTDSLSKINPKYVFKDGQLVAKNRKLLVEVTNDYSEMVTKGVSGLDDFKVEELEIQPLEISEDGTTAKVYLFDVYGRGHAQFYKEVWVPYVDGKVVPVYEEEEYNRISIIKRYNKKEDGYHVINGLFKGVKVDRGAVATIGQTPVPYFVVVGKENSEMYKAVKEVDTYSGACVVVEGEDVLATFPLEIYGMMANLSMEELVNTSEEIDKALETLGNHNEGEPVTNKLLSLFISLHRFRFMHEE